MKIRGEWNGMGDDALEAWDVDYIALIHELFREGEGEGKGRSDGGVRI